MVSAIYILYWPDSLEYPHSQILLHRRYQNDIPKNQIVINNFDQMYKQLNLHERVPFLLSRGINYTYVNVANDLKMVAVARKNINAMLIIVFLHNFYQILYRYLCNNKNSHNQDRKVIQLDKDIIIDNINVCFELLDECMDFGIIQSTDYNLLKEYIKVEVNLPKSFQSSNEADNDDYDDDDHYFDHQNGVKARKSKVNIKKNDNIKSTKGHAVIDDVLSNQNKYSNSSILKTGSMAINWRPKGVFYVKNEIYLDIVEDCHFFYDLGSNVIRRNEIYGTCTAICYLSGMPVCQLGFNEENISGIDRSDIKHINRELKINLLKNNNDDDDEDDNDEVDDFQEEDVTKEKEKEKKSEGESSLSNRKHNKIPLRNVQFHQCVELSSIYENDVIKFIPPDDTFILMTYHVEQQKQSQKLPLIMIQPMYRIITESNKLQIMCVLKTNFKKRLHCRDLIVQIPIDPNLFEIDLKFNVVDDLKFKSELGEVSFKIDTSELYWKFDDITGRRTIKMMAEIPLNENEIDGEVIENHFNLYESKENYVDYDAMDTKDSLDDFYGVNGHNGSLLKRIVELSKTRHDFNNIILSFSIPLLTYSGIKVNYLTVDEETLKYTCFPWVKYITRSRSNTNKKPDNQGFEGQNCYYRFKLASNCFQVV